MHDIFDVWNSAPISMNDGTYRVPVKEADDEYTVSIGSLAYRYFTGATVPDQIKASLSMVKAFPEEIRRIPKARLVSDVAPYICPHPSLEDIGWQVGDDTYVLILGEELLERMHISG